jgi:hypothetical protein
MTRRRKPSFQVELADEGGSDVPIYLRLRKALKVLLRAFRLRCTKIEPVIEPKPAGRDTPGHDAA